MKIKTYPEATQELRKIAAFCKQQWGIEIAHRMYGIPVVSRSEYSAATCNL